MTWAIRFEDISKRYRGGQRGYPSLRSDLTRLARRVLTPLRPAEKPSGWLALDHLSFEVPQGEAFAIIGPNGAGKTTTLKMLTRISHPTSGRLRVRGRVGALIEVGSGVHPELTGRENIWLYGRIIGMSRPEIARRFDDIVDFAELSESIDMPVKMYSSGMQLRLGFAVASHIDPDIFVVDEALAVGDAGFQVKCIERMTRLVSEGRTLVFVSHNLSAVETICPRGLFLLDGRIEAIGEAREVLRRYLDWVDTRQQARIERKRQFQSRPSKFLTVDRVSFHDGRGQERAAFRTGETVEIRLMVSTHVPVRRPYFEIGISDGRPGNLILCSMLADGHVVEVVEGPTTVTCRIPQLPLLPRVYQIWCSVRSHLAQGELFDWQLVGAFRVADGPAWLKGPGAIAHTGTEAPIHTDYTWRVTTDANAGVGDAREPQVQSSATGARGEA
jgi:ABC-type polysaccharide/polyol phosphate transport system ATPase subunit